MQQRWSFTVTVKLAIGSELTEHAWPDFLIMAFLNKYKSIEPPHFRSMGLDGPLCYAKSALGKTSTEKSRLSKLEPKKSGRGKLPPES